MRIFMNAPNHKVVRTKRIHYWPPIFWCLHHLRSATQSIGHLLRMPITSVLTVMVIGVTFSVPLILAVAVQNLQQLSPNWPTHTQISVYLSADASSSTAERVANETRAIPNVQNVQYISPSEGIAELKKNLNLGEALDALSENPLPGVLLVTPAPSLPAAQLQQLLQELGQFSGVAEVKLDLAWIKRLHALLNLGQQMAWMLCALLAAGVLLIIGNVVSLMLQQHRQEMRVYRLMGASDFFIRQPFLYMGALLGLFGSGLAWACVAACWQYLSPAVRQLATQYTLMQQVSGISWTQGGLCCAFGAFLGLMGAQISVRRCLKNQ
jgi:cell division transport system permease protein